MGALPEHGLQHGLAARPVEAVLRVCLTDTIALRVVVLRGHGHARHAELGTQTQLQRLHSRRGAVVLGVHDGHLRGGLPQQCALVHRPQLGVEPAHSARRLLLLLELVQRNQRACRDHPEHRQRDLAVRDRLDQRLKRLHDVGTAAHRAEQVHIPA